MQRDDPAPPNDTTKNMHDAFQQYLQKVDARIVEPETPKDVLLEREGRGISLFTQKWKRAISQWGGKVKEAASDVQDSTFSAPRSLDELILAAKNVCADDADAISALVNEAARLDSVKRDLVLREIKKKTGLGLGVLREFIRRSLSNAPPDQLVLARKVIDEIGPENIFVTDGALWQWSPCGVWRKIDERLIKRKLQNCADGENQTVTSAYVSGALDLFKNELLSQDHRFNLGNPETVNCLNGELELNDTGWSLVSHRRELYRTTQIPVTYDPNAKAPLFSLFLQQVFRDDPDKDAKIKSLLELIGYTLMSHARHEKFVLLIGPGANGKSVLLAVLEALCGTDNVAGVQPSNFDRTFQRAHLYQKLANIVTELKQGEIIADAELKAITSGEPSTVERKFCDPFVMRPFSTCWFGTNHMPHTRDFSDALFRRSVILTFNRIFATHEQDPMLKDKLKTELPGILNMALCAYALALKGGFTEPTSSKAAKLEWRLEADQVAQFVDECCQRQLSGKETIDDVFNAYGNWAQKQGITKTMAKKGFRDRLTRLRFGSNRTGSSRYVIGIILNQQSRSSFHH
jgi:putative DNA primase/helicase